MQYQLIANSNYLKRTDPQGVITFIPDDPANTDWQAYQAWLAADPVNNVPLPADG